MKKKLMYVVEAFGGGVFTYIVEMANHLVDEYDVYILYATRHETPDDFADRFDSRVHLIHSRFLTREISPLKDIRSLFEIRHYLLMINPDVIHFHSSKAGILGRFAAINVKAKVFYTPHGYSFTMKNISKPKKMFYLFMESICGRLGAMTISCSLGEYSESKKVCKNNQYVNNGIDIDEIQKIISSNENLKSNHQYTVCTLGRITAQKNPKLFNLIATQNPDVRFIWIGGGDQRGLLTAENIEVTGWVTHEVAINTMRSADAFLLPSLWEGLPLALLEAMYIGNICIVSNVIGNRDVIVSGQNGFVCNELVDYQKVLDDLKLRKVSVSKIVENARLDIVHRYSVKTMIDKYKKIYSGKIGRIHIE